MGKMRRWRLGWRGSLGGEDEVWEGEIEVWEGEDDWDENEGWENTADDGLVEGAGASSAANGI